MSHGKQFTLYTHYGGPNGWKVAFVLELLKLSYESIYLDFSKNEQKAPEFTKFNPNGRIPALIDHNRNDFSVWESDAILLYLVERYDPEHKVSVSDPDEKTHQLQWLFFQSSGQGPYFGQHYWFQKWHPEIETAVARYKSETLRVFGVLEGVLAARDWLVGGKMTVADVSFLPWNILAYGFLLDESVKAEERFPKVTAWYNRIRAVPEIAAALVEREKLIAAAQ